MRDLSGMRRKVNGEAGRKAIVISQMPRTKAAMVKLEEAIEARNGLTQ